LSNFKDYLHLISKSIRIFREAKDKLSRYIIYEDVFIDCEQDRDLYYAISISRVDGPWYRYYRYRIANYSPDIEVQFVHIRYRKRLSPVHIYKLLLKRKEK
jgi:hypothetical protein